MPDIPFNIREQVVLLNQHTSKSQREIAADLGITQKSVSNILRLHASKGTVETSRSGHCGRKQILSEKDKRLLVRESKKIPSSRHVN